MEEMTNADRAIAGSVVLGTQERGQTCQTRNEKLCAVCGKTFYRKRLSFVAFARASLCSVACRTKHLTGRQYKSFQMRLQEKISPEPNSGCWLWTGALNKGGYAHSYVGAKCHLMHRVSFELHRGAIPDGMLVCHRCDTRSCVNPGHLFIGTPADNTTDCVNKGRQSKGASRWNAKLTAEQVQEIRRLDASMTRTAIAKKFRISRPVVQKVCDRKSWSHVP